MKINPINNYQINRNQKAKAKSNTNFEGVKFKFDIRRSFDPEFFIKNNNLDSPAKVMEFNKTLDSHLRELNLKVNTVKLPKVLESILLSRRIYLENENYTADINERIWPEDTEYTMFIAENQLYFDGYPWSINQQVECEDCQDIEKLLYYIYTLTEAAQGRAGYGSPFAYDNLGDFLEKELLNRPGLKTFIKECEQKQNKIREEKANKIKALADLLE